MIRAVASTRPDPGLIHVTFSDGSTAELRCPAAVIGNPIARVVTNMDRAADRSIPWTVLDAGEHQQVLDHMLTRFADGFEPRFDIAPGWYGLLVDAHERLLKVDREYRLTQVRQFFGSFKLRAWPHIPAFREIKWQIRERSYATCEWCAGYVDPAAPSYSAGGWVMTLCPPCATLCDTWRTISRERM